jgi:hypothetical protein
MTYSAVARNTKIESIVYHTTSFKVVLFVKGIPIGLLATRILFVGMVNK